MSPTPPPGPDRRLKITLYALGLLAAIGYLAYSTATQTGLGGWLMALQIQLLGGASQKLTIALPLLAAFSLLKFVLHRFDPQTMAAVTAPPAPGPDGRPPGLQVRTLLWLSAAPILLTLPLYYYLETKAKRDQRRPVVALSLINQPQAPVPADTKYARLEAVFQSDYQYIIEQTRYSRVEKTDRYVPLTGPDWRPGQPIRFFLDTSVASYFDEANQRTISFDDTTPFPGTFSGELHAGHLPFLVRREFEKQNLRLAEPHFVLETLYMPNGQPPSAASQQYWLIPTFGGAFSLIFLLSGGLGILIRRRRA